MKLLNKIVKINNELNLIIENERINCLLSNYLKYIDDINGTKKDFL